MSRTNWKYLWEVRLPQRTNIPAVQDILGSNYGARTDGTLPSLQPYIDTAWPMVDQAMAMAVKKRVYLTACQQEIIERWLSAYFYTKTDPLYQSKSTASASASMVSEKVGDDADANRYKQAAIQADVSGCLNALLNRKIVITRHLGGGHHARDYCGSDGY
jgi:hypothetical protein